MRVKSECQRLLTVGNRACGGALERGDRRVRLEEVGNCSDAISGVLSFTFVVDSTELVAGETATKASKGAHENAST